MRRDSMDSAEIKALRKIAIDIRRHCIRTQKTVGSGHLGGAFSAVELMVYLYFKKMNIDINNPLKEDRDIFVISKGHASIGYYSVLAERGFFPIEELKTYRKINSRLQGHTHIDDAPGIECTTGSLGQGLSFGIGLALGYCKKKINNKIFVLLGDGEIEEGQVWEAAMLQGHLRLKNLVVIIDSNRLQLDDTCENIIELSDLESKFRAFGFNTITIDGHDFNQIEAAFEKLKPDSANVIIANTVKGKGISFMENQVIWHAQKVNEEEYVRALQELDNQELEVQNHD
jgi:transketolase